jgi:hypothetical protein
MMIEFRFIPDDHEVGGQGGAGGELLSLLKGRLPRLLGIAETLTKAGWTMRLTITGLAFDPPADAEFEDDEDLEELVRSLGVEEPFTPFPSRTPEELGEAVGEFFDRVWYERKLVLINEPGYDPKAAPDITRGMLRGMQEIEQKYAGTLEVEDDFHWGMINGKLSALRWAFGDEWDMLDT